MQYATVSADEKRFLSVSPDAWQWIGWRWIDPRTGKQRVLPAEMFGPLPVHEATGGK
jgi:hypothetical protein